MVDNHSGNDLLDTTDCLEAVGVFKGWKNFLFLVILLCLLLLQVSFYLVDRGYIKIGGQVYGDEPTAEAPAERPGEESSAKDEPNEPAEEIVAEPDERDEPAESVEPNEVAEPNEPAESNEATEDAGLVEPNEPAQPDETVEAGELAEPNEPAEPTEAVDVAEPSEPNELAEPNEPEKLVESVEPNEPAEPKEAVDVAEPSEPNELAEPNEPEKLVELIEPNEPSEPNEAVDVAEPSEPNEPAEPNEIIKSSSAFRRIGPKIRSTAPQVQYAGQWIPKDFMSKVTFEQLTLLIRLVNAILLLTATLYCLTLLFSLKVSMNGRLGGINHISRAFFLSLLMLVLLLPWQQVFGSVVTGAIFTPEELVTRFAAKTDDILDIALYYLRFSGYGVLMLLLLILSQLRSLRWAKAILRRLEII